MKKVSRLIIATLVALACLTFTLFHPTQFAFTQPTPTIQNPTEIPQSIDFGRHFQELAVKGSILIEDLRQNRTYQHNPQRNSTAFLPGSTFKILNSLISLETGITSDELQMLTWDGIQRQIPAWNRDLNMKEAIKISAVWFYQVLARRVGYDRMQKWVTQVGYGNSQIGSKQDIDKFWLQGELRITPQEQIQFLRRLYNNKLPFPSDRSRLSKIF